MKADSKLRHLYSRLNSYSRDFFSSFIIIIVFSVDVIERLCVQRICYVSYTLIRICVAAFGVYFFCCIFFLSFSLSFIFFALNTIKLVLTVAWMIHNGSTSYNAFMWFKGKKNLKNQHFVGFV